MPTSGDSIIIFSGSSPRNWHTLTKLHLFFLPTFLWIFPFNLVLLTLTHCIHLCLLAIITQQNDDTPTIMVPVSLCQLVHKSHFTVVGFTFLFVTFTS